MAGFYERAIEAMQKAVNEQFGGNVRAASDAWGLKNDTLHKWLRRERTPQLDLISPILDQLCSYSFGDDRGTIRRIAPNAPVEEISGHELSLVPVIGEVGAGNEIDLLSATPEYYLRVPERYYSKGCYGLVVEGDSMEPTIRKGAIVGALPFAGNLVEGAIYLVRSKYFGLRIKRVRMGKNGRLEVYSDNSKYEPEEIPPEEYDELVVARIIWVWQEC